MGLVHATYLSSGLEDMMLGVKAGVKQDTGDALSLHSDPHGRIADESGPPPFSLSVL